MNTIYEHLPVIAIVLSIAGFLFQQFGIIGTIRERLATLETKMEIFWAGIGDQVKEMLKQPIHLRKDELLDKFPDLDDNELRELRNIIVCEREEVRRENPKADRALLLSMMKASIDMEIINRCHRKKKKTTMECFLSNT